MEDKYAVLDNGEKEVPYDQCGVPPPSRAEVQKQLNEVFYPAVEASDSTDENHSDAEDQMDESEGEEEETPPASPSDIVFKYVEQNNHTCTCGCAKMYTLMFIRQLK